MSYATYQECKDSGLQWLGKIPDHWDTVQSRRLFMQRKERARAGDEQLTASQKYGVIYQKDFMEIEQRQVTQVLTGSEILKHVEPNDFVISMRSFQGGLEYCKYPGSVSSAYVGLIPIKYVVPRYFRYLFKCLPYIQALQSTSNLVRDGQALRFENFAQVSLPLVGSEEQRTIAAFLDHETAKIDTLIAKQERLIELLKEKRQAVISHAVTKGLDPDVPMKDSGAEWLGEVPTHWTVTKLKWIVEMAGRIGYRGYTVDDIVEEGEGAIVLSPANIDDRGFNLKKKVFISWEKYLESPEIMLESGDVMLVKTSWSFGKVAVVSHVSSPMTINPQMVLLKKSKIDAKFLSYFLNTDALQAKIFTINTGSYMPTMTQENIGELPVHVPPVDEAVKIADFTDNQFSKFTTLLDRQKNAIELLRERRTALISAAVTGKIDVRDWKPDNE